ncbi:MAG: PAS domain-containing protein [Verrucomicrobiota bacterium]
MKLLFLDDSPAASAAESNALLLAGFSAACRRPLLPLESLLVSLREQTYDAGFLVLKDENTLEGIRSIHTAAPRMPLVVIVAPENEPLGMRALEHGALDYLLTAELNHRVLGRLMRNITSRALLEEQLVLQAAATPQSGVNEWRDAEEMIRESREKLTLALDAAELGTWEWDTAAHRGIWSERCKAMSGLPPEAEMTFERAIAAIHPEDQAFVQAAFKKAISEHIDCDIEYRTVWPDGVTVRWLSLRGRTTYDSEGNPVRTAGTVQNITRRKHAEEALRRLNVELEGRMEARTRELKAANSELNEEMQARRRLEAEILEISEREQSRLGQDLHDGLGQELAGIALLCKVLANKLNEEEHPQTQSANSICNLISLSINSARDLAKGFYPVELERGGLLIALQDLANHVSQRFGVTCELRYDDFHHGLEKNAKIHLYRMIQESMANAIKHGQATSIFIEAKTEAATSLFSVTDNGIGFQPPPANSPGIGLHLMNYRARLIGAQISMEEAPAGGCRVIYRLPRRIGSPNA